MCPSLRNPLNSPDRAPPSLFWDPIALNACRCNYLCIFLSSPIPVFYFIFASLPWSLAQSLVHGTHSVNTCHFDIAEAKGPLSLLSCSAFLYYLIPLILLEMLPSLAPMVPFCLAFPLISLTVLPQSPFWVSPPLSISSRLWLLEDLSWPSPVFLWKTFSAWVKCHGIQGLCLCCSLSWRHSSPHFWNDQLLFNLQPKGHPIRRSFPDHLSSA